MRQYTRRDALRVGIVLGGVVAGCTGPPTADALLNEGFESGLDDWETASAIGPEESPENFEWRIERSTEQAHGGERSALVFTEGDHDDGTAWLVRPVDVPDDASAFRVSAWAWSESESFNTLRNLVMYLGAERPSEETDFPDPGQNSTGIEGAPVGGLREPLHRVEGWDHYEFEWRPDSVPKRLFVAVGVSVVWESDATHFVDDVSVRSI